MPNEPLVTEGALVAFLASLATVIQEIEMSWRAAGADPIYLRYRIRDLLKGAEVPAVGEPLSEQDIQNLRHLHALFEYMLDRPEPFLVDPRKIQEN